MCRPHFHPVHPNRSLRPPPALDRATREASGWYRSPEGPRHGQAVVYLPPLEARLRAWAMIFSKSASKTDVIRSNVSNVGFWTSCST